MALTFRLRRSRKEEASAPALEPSMSTDAVSSAAPAAAPASNRPDRDDPLWQQAVKLEALLFGQLLEVAGVGGLSPVGSPKDGPGARFDSFLREQHAQAIAGSGATGLAQRLYADLKTASDAGAR